MKKRISLALSLCIAASMIHIPISAADTTGDYIAQLSEMAAEYDNGSYFGTKCVVAVVDSGIAYDHPFFSGRIVDGYDIYNNDNYCEDIVQHGTHVSSTVLDVADGNRNVKVMPVKVFGSENSTTNLMVAAGIDDAVQNGADVINLSLGGQAKSEVEKRAVQRAQQKKHCRYCLGGK